MKLALAIAFVVVGLSLAASVDMDKERAEARRGTDKSLERRALDALAKSEQKSEERRSSEEKEAKDEVRRALEAKEDKKAELRRAVEKLEKEQKKSEERREIEKEDDKERREITSGGGEFRWETIPIAENASQCIYSPESRSISCRGMSGLVECPASIELPKGIKVEVFGMRRHPVKSMVSSIEKRIYELYPRKLDNSSYMNYTVTVDEKPVELYLFYSETSGDSFGVRVSDKKCYMRLINVVLSQATAEHEVKVEGTELSVDLFGEILNAEKPTNKRWLGFGWPWLWGMGLWGWGLGWGLPFWG